MAFNRYFQEELTYLRELGTEFARANPNLVRFLGEDSTDPDVQRLIEGFAFIAGRLRQKLDDEAPELSHALFQVLFPHYLRPIPPISVLEFVPRPGALSEPRRVPAGALVETAPIEGTRCRFRTCFPVSALPLTIADARMETTATRSALTLRLETTTPGLDIGALGLDRLRLYLHAGTVPATSRWLYLYLTRHLREVQASVGDGPLLDLGPEAVAPYGLDGTASVLPYPETAFPGFRLIQEYFAAPSRFMFVEVGGLDGLRDRGGRTLDLVFGFDRPMQAGVAVTASSLRLNATPIVNIFPTEGEPITVDHRKTEYRVRAAAANATHLDVFSVDEVTGRVPGRGTRIDYPPFESFRNTAAGDLRSHDPAAGGVYFRVRRRPAVSGTRVDTMVAFVRGSDRPAAPETEMVSLRLSCTNGPLAERIGIGAVTEATGDTPPELTFRNIESVSSQVPPPVRGDVLWRLIANMALNFSTLADRDALRAMLAAYEFGALVDDQRRQRLDLLLDGIERVTSRPIDPIVRGVPVRGAELTLSVSQERLGGLAEAYLLGTVLDRLFATYASINACHRFVLRCSETNTVFSWPIRTGQMAVV